LRLFDSQSAHAIGDQLGFNFTLANAGRKYDIVAYRWRRLNESFGVVFAALFE
jgi:hypothetical protein